LFVRKEAYMKKKYEKPELSEIDVLDLQCDYYYKLKMLIIFGFIYILGIFITSLTELRIIDAIGVSLTFVSIILLVYMFVGMHRIDFVLDQSKIKIYRFPWERSKEAFKAIQNLYLTGAVMAAIIMLFIGLYKAPFEFLQSLQEILSDSINLFIGYFVVLLSIASLHSIIVIDLLRRRYLKLNPDEEISNEKD